MADGRGYVLARFEPTHHGWRMTARPSHIVLNELSRFGGGYKNPALCGVNVYRKIEGKLATATCQKCLRRAIRQGIIQAPPELPDPVHHGDIFSRIEATGGR